LRAAIAIVTVKPNKPTNRKENGTGPDAKTKKAASDCTPGPPFVDGLDLRKKPREENHRTDART
jgi:hypothetical protein